MRYIITDFHTDSILCLVLSCSILNWNSLILVINPYNRCDGYYDILEQVGGTYYVLANMIVIIEFGKSLYRLEHICTSPTLSPVSNISFKPVTSIA